ncbi:hypothetical protein PRNP1_013931 [Phytophthora ramorum]
MVTMRGGTAAALEEAETLSSPSSSEANVTLRGDRITRLVKSLKTSATLAQRSVIKLLDQKAATFASSTTLWISNQLFIANASMELIQRLALESSIVEIHEEQSLSMGNSFKEEHFELFELMSGLDLPLRTNTQAWGVGKIGAEAVWAQGVIGENVTVGTIDTGVRATHEALRDNFRGDYGWFDPETKRAEPYDTSGHGTHVVGSIVGVNGIGVAPGAKWMTCRGCRSTTSCLESSLLACAQFVLCPTDPEGENYDCRKAPRIVNNSWGTARGAVNFSAVIAAWRAAEIIPIFAIGNSGSSKTCSTVESPGEASNVIGVGATSSEDVLLPQSSTGPSIDGRVKPDITAPGVRIYSAWWTRDNVYTITSGTSMAAPHVAGAVALLLSAKPELTFEQVWTALTSAAVRDGNLVKNAAFHSLCGNISASTFPNNIFGYGRVDVQRAVAAVGGD